MTRSNNGALEGSEMGRSTAMRSHIKSMGPSMKPCWRGFLPRRRNSCSDYLVQPSASCRPRLRPTAIAMPQQPLRSVSRVEKAPVKCVVRRRSAVRCSTDSPLRPARSYSTDLRHARSGPSRLTNMWIYRTNQRPCAWLIRTWQVMGKIRAQLVL
jgi:hypothetical protein